MRTLILAGALCLAAAPAFAETRTLNTPAFHAVDVAGPYVVEITQGAATSVIADGTARGLGRTRIYVANGVLHVRQRCTLFCGSRGRLARVTIVTPRLDAVEAVMGADVSARGLDVAALSADAAMGANLTLSGACGRLTADAAMGANLDARDLRCRAVRVDAAMGANVDVFASESVEADAAMGGVIEVDGRPATNRVARAMGGDVSIN